MILHIAIAYRHCLIAVLVATNTLRLHYDYNTLPYEYEYDSNTLQHTTIHYINYAPNDGILKYAVAAHSRRICVTAKLRVPSHVNKGRLQSFYE